MKAALLHCLPQNLQGAAETGGHDCTSPAGGCEVTIIFNVHCEVAAELAPIIWACIAADYTNDWTSAQ